MMVNRLSLLLNPSISAHSDLLQQIIFKDALNRASFFCPISRPDQTLSLLLDAGFTGRSQCASENLHHMLKCLESLPID